MKDKKNIWILKIFILTFVLSVLFSYISENGIDKLNIAFSILILIIVIIVGVLFDIIGVAVMVANEHEFHAKATKKIKGSKKSIALIKDAPKVANICADVIGDICGVLSGAICAMIASRIYSMYGMNLSIILTALVSALTVGSKAIGKEIANKYATKIVHIVGIVLSKFERKNK